MEGCRSGCRTPPIVPRELKLAERYGGRSGAIRHAVRHLAAEQFRQDALQTALDDWQADRGPVDEDAVADAIRQFGLAR